MSFFLDKWWADSSSPLLCHIAFNLCSILLTVTKYSAVYTNRYLTSHSSCTSSAPDDINEEFSRPIYYFLQSEWYLTEVVPCLRRLVLVLQRGSPGSFPGQSVCHHLWWTEWHWDNFTYSASFPPVSVILTLDPTPYPTSITGII